MCDREYVVEEAPGSGIVIPGGVHTYFLDLKPGYTTPMVSGGTGVTDDALMRCGMDEGMH